MPTVFVRCARLCRMSATNKTRDGNNTHAYLWGYAMSKSLIYEVIALTKEGWRPYNGQPEGFVYESLGCKAFKRGKRPLWFMREDVFCCVGCANRCSLTRPAGFPLPLPMQIKYTIQNQPYALTPMEMVERKNLLSVKEASYCLNVSERLIYDWIDEGLLISLKRKPIRIRASDVKAMMNDFDE